MKTPTYRLLNDYFKPQYKTIIYLVFLLILSQIGYLLEPMLLKKIIDNVIPNSDIKGLIILTSIAIILKIVTLGISKIIIHISTKSSEKIFRNFVVDFYNHLQHLSLSFFSETKMGELSQRLSQDIYHVYQMIFSGLMHITSNIILLISLYAYGFYLSPSLMFLIISTIPLYFVAQKYAGKKSRKANEEMIKNWTEVSSFQNEKLSGIRLIKELVAENRMKDLYDKLNKNSGDSFKKIELTNNLSHIFSDFTMFIGPIFVLIYGGYLSINNKLSIGTFLTFFYFCNKLITPITQIIEKYLQLQRSKVAINRIYEYLDKTAEVQLKDIPTTLDNVPLSVEFKNVDFSYSDNQPILKSLSLKIDPGQVVGIVGKSGAGKSTIANLIYRFYDIQKGEILINNIDIKELSTDNLRNNLGIVSQETILFHDTIIENLKLANPKAKEKDIVECCKLAGIDSFINTLPKKYNTIIGENGTKLSGGQRQRLSIARAYLRNPKLIILDEATSSLDSYNEHLFQNSLKSLTDNRTTIIIAHRLSTLSLCDKIIVIDDGEAIEEGTHHDLLKKSELYRRLWQLQSQK